jgi:hypothetical protein
MGESMLMLHGAGMPLRPQAGAPDLDADVDEADEADDTYEDDLFGLLAHLEYLREGMVGARLPTVLALGGELLDQVLAFADRYGPIGSIMPGPDPAEVRAADFRAGWKSLREQVTDAGSKCQAPAGRCYVALYDAVFAYFVIFTNRFPTSRAAHGWVEVAATFVTELKRTLRDLDRGP